MQSVTIGPNQAGQRFDKFLHKYLPEATSGLLYKMLRKKNIVLNGRKSEGNEQPKEGDLVEMYFAQETFEKLRGAVQNPYRHAYAALQGIAVVYEDEHALILNKPAGVLTQKASEQDISLNEWMIGYLLAQGNLNEEDLQSFHPSVCNRLDRNTSGLVLCGKSLAGSQALSKLIHDRAIKKFYRTIVTGKLTESAFIEGYLQKDEKTNQVRVLSAQTFAKMVETGSGQTARADRIQTAYKPLAWGRMNQKHTDITYLEVELITGKTHQIRAHLAHIEHPLLGDTKYGRKDINGYVAQHDKLRFQLLHAYRLEFPALEGVLKGLSRQQIIAPLPKLFEDMAEEYISQDALENR